MWFELSKELRNQRSEAQKDFMAIVDRSSAMVTPIVESIYKIGQFQAQMLVDQGESKKAQGIKDFCEQIKTLTVGKTAR